MRAPRHAVIAVMALARMRLTPAHDQGAPVGHRGIPRHRVFCA
jgi:hypothetical protein